MILSPPQLQQDARDAKDSINAVVLRITSITVKTHYPPKTLMNGIKSCTGLNPIPVSPFTAFGHGLGIWT
jgi:hypothetical protein